MYSCKKNRYFRIETEYGFLWVPVTVIMRIPVLVYVSCVIMSVTNQIITCL